MKTKTKFRIGKKICVLLVTALLLTACGIGNTYGLSAQSPLEITVWSYYNGTQAVAFENLVNEFNSTIGAKEGIFVTSVSKSNITDLADALTKSLKKEVGAEKLPDIVQCYTDTAVLLEKQNLLVDLDTYVTPEEKALYVDSYLEEGKIGADKKWKIFPIAKSTEVLVLNETCWKQFSKETKTPVSELATWEGLIRVSEKYYDWSGGKAFFGRDAMANYMLAGSEELGNPIVAENENGQAEIKLDVPAMRTLWENYYIPYVEGYFSHVGKYRTDDIKLGKIIAAVNSTTGCTYFPKEVSVDDGEPYPIACMVLPVPAFQGHETYTVQQGAGMSVLKSQQASEYASVVFLKWFTQAERNLAFSIGTGYLPVQKSVNSMEILENEIKRVREQGQTDVLQVDENVLKVGMEELLTKKHSYTPEFDESYDVRYVLEYSLIGKAQEDYEAVQAEIAQGKTREEVLKPYFSEENFKSWYRQLRREIKQAMEQ